MARKGSTDGELLHKRKLSKAQKIAKASRKYASKGEKYVAPQKGNNGVNKSELSRYVKKYNSHWDYESKRLMANTGLSREELVRTGAVAPKLTVRGLMKNIESDYQLALTIDGLRMDAVRKNKSTDPSLYVGKLEKKTGQKYPRPFDYLPRSRDEQIRFTFKRLLEDSTNLSDEKIEYIQNNMTTEDILKFQKANVRLMDNMYEKYQKMKVGEYADVKFSERVEKAVYKYIAKKNKQ